jgi:ribonuclease P protein component
MAERQFHIDTLKKRAAFLRMNENAGRFVVSNFILQMAPSPALPQDELRIGYTVTKKIGNSVVRNRVKRRLREAVKQAASRAKGGHHYVFIARHKALNCDFAELVREMEFAFSRIKAK